MLSSLHAGIVLVYLRPYSPDLNPIEEMSSYIKGYLKDFVPFILCNELLKSAFDNVTAEQCEQWIADCNCYDQIYMKFIILLLHDRTSFQ